MFKHEKILKYIYFIVFFSFSLGPQIKSATVDIQKSLEGSSSR